jgi:hypothetical protein
LGDRGARLDRPRPPSAGGERFREGAGGSSEYQLRGQFDHRGHATPRGSFQQRPRDKLPATNVPTNLYQWRATLSPLTPRLSATDDREAL